MTTEIDSDDEPVLDKINDQIEIDSVEPILDSHNQPIADDSVDLIETVKTEVIEDDFVLDLVESGEPIEVGDGQGKRIFNFLNGFILWLQSLIGFM